MPLVFGLWSRTSSGLSNATFQTLLSNNAQHGALLDFSTSIRPPIFFGSTGEPVVTTDSHALVAAVRLDDRARLLDELRLAPTEADAAIVLAAWRRWGDGSLEHLVGAFAGAFWCARTQTLTLFRDHAGEYPLFYANTPQFLAFSSRPTSLQGLPGVDIGVDERRIVDTLAIFPPKWTASFLKDVQRLPPGHLLRVTAHGTGLVRYWHPANVRPLRLGSDRAYEEALVDLLDRATLDRMRTSGAIGSQLSAGLDSTSVTASAAIQLQRRGERLTAFTAVPRRDFGQVGLAADIVDEGPGAAAVARRYANVEHLLVDSSGKRLLEDAKPVTQAIGEPLLNIGNWMWMRTMFELARERGITVMLNGSHGNATLSYDGTGALATLFRTGRWLQLARTVRTLRQDGETGLRNAAAMTLGGLLPPALRRLLRPRRRYKTLGHAALHPRLAAGLHLDQRALAMQESTTYDMAEERRQLYERFDFGAVNAGFAEATGVAYRDPTGDKRLWEFCYAIPVEQYLANGHSRSLVRRAMRHRLPPEIVEEYRIGLQGADWYLTVREAVPDLLAELDRIALSPTARRLLDLERMRWLLLNWPSSGFEQRSVAFSWNFALTRSMILGYFIRCNDPVAIATLARAD